MRRALALSALLALTACAAGPNYRAPATASVAPARFTEAEGQPEASGELRDDWWRLYANPDLDRLIARAFAANTSLRAAEANVTRARGLLDEARLNLMTPSTTLSASQTTGRSATTNLVGAIEGFKPKSSSGGAATFAAAWELDLFGGLRRAEEAAHADLGAAKAARDAVRIAVASDTARAYADACAYGEAVDVAEGSLKTAQAARDLIAARKNLGAASELDARRADALAAQAAAALPAAEARRRSALYALAVLTGETPEHVDPAAAACRTAPRLDAPFPLGDGAGLLKRRPDVRAAERSLAAATARIGVATAQLYPRITFAGQISAAGVTPAQAVQYDNTSFGFGPILSWSFPNIGQTRARIVEARAGADVALANFDGTVLTALKETETALATLKGERARNAGLRAARDAYAEAETLAEAQYRAGSIGYFELLDAQRALLSARNDLAASDLALAEAETGLFRALGGGWRVRPAG